MESSLPTISEADIFAHVIDAEGGGLSPESARALISLRFSDQANTRMGELLEKNRSGTLTAAERDEMGKYLRVGLFLNLITAKARVSLARVGQQPA